MRTESKSKISISIKTLDIKFVDFSVLKKLPNSYAKTGLIKANVQFEFTANINIQKTTRQLHIDLNISFFGDIQKTDRLGSISSSGDFEVLNLDDLVVDDKNKIPLAFLGNIAGILISTTRGFLILKSEGTIMEGIILPLIDPGRLFIPKHPIDPEK